MDILPTTLSDRVAAELASITDDQVRHFIEGLLLPVPEAHLRDWNYGDDGQQFLCWTVLGHARSKTEICFCNEGFGPTMPWGLVNGVDEPDPSIGMDSGWFFTFLEAFFGSIAATELPIWHVFKGFPGETGYGAVTDRGEWNFRWNQVRSLRQENPDDYYTVDTTLSFPRSW